MTVSGVRGEDGQARAKRQAALTMIADDMADDVARLNGQPLTGALLGEIHGNLAAAIAAIANIVAQIDTGDE